MSTGTIVSVCNESLLLIGSQSQISSLNEQSTQGNACNTLYTPRFESLARAANWNCLRKEASLTLLAAASGTPENPDGTTLPIPPIPYLYSYQYPSDCLQFRFIMPSLSAQNAGVPIFSVNTGAPTWLPNQGQIPYVVSLSADSNNNPVNVILTNQSAATGVYTANQPNPQFWDSLFHQAMVATLAAWLAPALSMNMALMQMQIGIAEKLVAEARVRDGNESVTSMDRTPDWIRARNGASGFNNGFGRSVAGCTYAYSPMAWPSY